MNTDFILCIDIGGTHITAAVIERESLTLAEGSLIHQEVDSQADRGRILGQWSTAIKKSLNTIKSNVVCVLVSIPGPFDYENGICLMDGMYKYQSLLHMDIGEYLATNLDVARERILFFNDAHAFLLGEVYHHKWIGNEIVGLTLGTGLGSAWYDGKIPMDLNYGSAIFREGIAEDYISTRGIIGFLTASVSSGREFKNIKDLVEAKGADEERTIAFSFLTTALIEFVQLYIVPLNPKAIVIGGSIAKAHNFFIESLRANTSIPIIIASMNEMNLFYGMVTTLDIK